MARDKEFATLIANDRRLTPDGFTTREMDQWARDNADALREAVQLAGAEDTPAAALEAETKEIYWAVRQQLEATRKPREVAAANAAQVAAVFGTLAQRGGMMPLQLWGMYAPDVAQQGGLTVEAEEVLPTGDYGGQQAALADVPPVDAPQIPDATGNTEKDSAEKSAEPAEGVQPGPESAFQKNFGGKTFDQTELGAEAEHNLQRDAADWSDSVDAFVQGTLSPRHAITMLRQTPLVLQMLGAENRPVVTSYSVLEKILVTKHKLPVESLKQVPVALANPVMVFRSDSIGGDLVVMLDVKDAQGATVVVPLALEQKGKSGYVVNVATSVYGKSREGTGTPNNAWFVEQARKGNLLYKDNKKSRDWMRSSRLQLPGVGALNLGNTKIYTDTDLVNLRRAHFDMYQGAVNAPRGRISFTTPSSRPLITLFQSADASTFLHESAHGYLEMLRGLGTAEDAPAAMADLWQQARDTLNKAAGQEVATDAVVSVAGHELWAASMEGYFLKGEAPSMGLRPVFARFAAWLKAIYNAWRSMGVQPAAELYPVFDRLFATDAQMAEVEDWHQAQKPWASIIAESEEQARQLREKQDKARADAAARRLGTLTRAYMQALGGKKRIWNEAWATVNSMPVYAAMDEAVQSDGIDYATVAALMGEEQARAINKKRPTLLRHEGGEDPALVAARYGYDSTAALLVAVLESEKKSTVAGRLAGQQELAIRDKVAQGVAENETMPGDVEYHSDAQLAVLLAQRQLLATRQRLEPGMERARQQQKDASLEASALREGATAAIAAMPVRQAMQAHRHSLAERRAARQAWAAAKAGDWEKAAQHKRQEAVSHAMYLAALEARATVKKGVTTVKNAAGFKKLSADARDLILDTAYRYGVMHYADGGENSYAAWQRDAKRDGRDFPTLAQWAEDVTRLGYPVAIADAVLQASGPQDYREMPLSDFGDVVGAIEQIRKVNRLEHTAVVNGRRVELSELRDALESAAAEHKKPDVRSKYRRERLKEGLGGIHAMHAKMEAILLDLDGWKHGIWWKTFFRPIADAENARSDMLRGVRDTMKELVSGIMPGRVDKYHFFNERVFIKEIQDSLTMNQMVAVALNMGNAANRQRLLEGEGWTQTQLDAVLSRLEKRHWDFAQGVWNYFETFRDPSFALQRDLTGITPKTVEALPVETAYGTYRGGYYPIAYDAQRGHDAYAREQKELDKQLFGGRNYGAAMTRHGHLKERARRGTGEPLRLDVSVVADHLYNTAHDLTHRRAVLEVAKIMRHKPVMQVVEQFAGKEVAREFKPWVQDIANEMQSQEGVTQLHRWARWARRGTTMMQMGLKATTILQQPLGILQTAAVLGAKGTMSGVWEMYHRPEKALERARWVMGKSPFMRNRMSGFDREVRDAMKNLALTGQITAEVERFAYMGIGIVQMGVDMPTWLGAYRKALSEGGEDADAVGYADSMVRLTQSNGMTKDLARVQRGGELMRLFTIFYSYFNALYQLAWRAGTLTKDWKDIPALAAQVLLLWFLPAVLSELVSGRGPDDDEGEEWAPWMVQKAALYPLQMVVGVRDVANFTAEAKYGYQLSPAASAGKALGAWPRSVMKAIEEEDPAKLLKPTVEGLGYLFVLPLKQPMITCGNIYDYATGVTPDFQLRDLLFTKQKSRR